MVRPSVGYGGELDDAVWSRIEASMHFREGDRVPIWDYIDNPAVVKHFQQPDDDYAATMVRVYHGLGIDLCRGYGRSFEQAEDGTVLGEGRGQQLVSGQTAWKVHYEIESVEDLREHLRKAEPVSWEWVRSHWVEWIRREQERFAPYTMFVPPTGCGFHAAYGLMGQQRFAYAIYDAPKELDALLELEGENAYRFAKVAAEEHLCPLHFIGDDIAYKNGLLFSPAFLRRTFIPMLKRCIEPLHEAGIKVIFHSDGNLWQIMDDLLDAGIDGLNPLEPIAGMELETLKKRYGDRLVLVGGIDCSQLLPLGAPDDIRREVERAMQVAAPGGGFFIGSSSEINPATPLENVLAFYEACREYGRYPVGG
ncbi:MAG: uroporphyrinogen decarboxylase family protein [Armatimonadota bacterium]|nr:uroporphyrinogen decarboxylase family protein [Armatimonadota bacterium]